MRPKQQICYLLSFSGLFIIFFGFRRGPKTKYISNFLKLDSVVQGKFTEASVGWEVSRLWAPFTKYIWSNSIYERLSPEGGEYYKYTCFLPIRITTLLCTLLTQVNLRYAHGLQKSSGFIRKRKCVLFLYKCFQHTNSLSSQKF